MVRNRDAPALGHKTQWRSPGDSDVACFNSLDELPPEMTALFSAAESRSFDLGLDWFRLLIQTTSSPADSVKVYAVSAHGGEAKAALVLRYQGDGSHLYALTNFYSTLYGPAVAQEDSTEFLTECFHAIRQGHPAVTVLRLQPLDRSGNDYDQLKMALSRAGWIVFGFFCFGNWYRPTPESGYQAFFDRLPSRLRHTLERKSRVLAARGDFNIRVISGGLELDQAINAYEQIYASSWKKLEPYPAFIPELIRLCACRGWLRLGLAYINHEVVAVQLWIVHQRRASIYKLAHDPCFDRYSVGTLLTNHMMRHVIEVDRVSEVDYLIGDDAYKKDWMTHRRERWGLIAYNPSTLSGLGMATQEFARYQVKRLRDWLYQGHIA